MNVSYKFSLEPKIIFLWASWAKTFLFLVYTFKSKIQHIIYRLMKRNYTQDRMYVLTALINIIILGNLLKGESLLTFLLLCNKLVWLQ